jgi:hypothetical protein
MRWIHSGPEMRSGPDSRSSSRAKGIHYRAPVVIRTNYPDKGMHRADSDLDRTSDPQGLDHSSGRFPDVREG